MQPGEIPLACWVFEHTWVHTFMLFLGVCSPRHTHMNIHIHRYTYTHMHIHVDTSMY